MVNADADSVSGNRRRGAQAPARDPARLGPSHGRREGPVHALRHAARARAQPGQGDPLGDRRTIGPAPRDRPLLRRDRGDVHVGSEPIGRARRAGRVGGLRRVLQRRHGRARRHDEPRQGGGDRDGEAHGRDVVRAARHPGRAVGARLVGRRHDALRDPPARAQRLRARPDLARPEEHAVIPDQPNQGNKLIPNGQARGLYDVVARPGGSGELWIAPHDARGHDVAARPRLRLHRLPHALDLRRAKGLTPRGSAPSRTP